MYNVHAVPDSPKEVNVTEVDTKAVVGLQVTWSAVTSAVSYSVKVERMNRRDSLTFTTTTTNFTVTSQNVGGYERVRVQVVAVNRAGSGPASNILTSRTPSIGWFPRSSLSLSLSPSPHACSLSLHLYCVFLPSSWNGDICDGV